MTKIYCLKDPESEDVMYVGRTESLLSTRLKQHIENAIANGASEKCQWIRDLIAAGRQPVIDLIYTCDRSARDYWESYWIKYYAMQKPLTNWIDKRTDAIITDNFGPPPTLEKSADNGDFEFQNIKMWRTSIAGLRQIYALTGEKMVSIVDRLARAELARLQRERGITPQV